MVFPTADRRLGGQGPIADGSAGGQGTQSPTVIPPPSHRLGGDTSLAVIPFTGGGLCSYYVDRSALPAPAHGIPQSVFHLPQSSMSCKAHSCSHHTVAEE